MNYFIDQAVAAAAQAPAAPASSRGPVINGVQFPEQNNYFLSGGVQQNVPGQTYNPQDLAAQSQQKYQQAIQQWQQTPGNMDSNPIIWRGSSESTPTQHRVYATNRTDIQGSIPIEEVSKYGYASMDMNGYSIPIQEYLKTTYIPAAQLKNLQTTYNIQPKPQQAGPTTQELQAEADRWRQAGGTPQQIQDWLKTQGAGAAGVTIKPMTGGGGSLGRSTQQVSGNIVNLNGGGNVTPESYLGSWVPPERRALISSVGFSGTGSEVLALRQAQNNASNNYERQALAQKEQNAQIRWDQEWKSFEPEYKALAMDALYAQARQTVAQETAAGRPTSLAAMQAQSVLSNNSVNIGIIQQGKVARPAGNALEDAMAAAKLTGKTLSPGLAKMLADSDAMTQDSYMPGASQYWSLNAPSSMGMGFGGGQGIVMGYDEAYGGDGSQYARQEAQNILRDHAWQQQANERYIQSINNRMPVGDRKGTGNGITITGVSGRVIGYSPSGSSGPAQNTGYGPNGEEMPWKESPMMKKLGWAEDWMGDDLEYDRDSGEFVPRLTKPEKIDPINDGYIRELNWRGQVDSQANQMRSQGVPEYQVQEFIKRMLKPNGMLQGPPANMDPNQMYGPPKTSMTLPLLETLFGIADAPEIKTVPKPLSGNLSPANTSYDSFDGPLFSNDSRFNTGQPYSNPFAKEYGLQAGTPSNQFDRYAVDPFTARQNAALLQPMNPMQLIRIWSNVNY